MPHVKLSESSQNLELYYEIHGSGEVKILFIMGLFTDGGAWCLQTKFFGEQTNYQCVSYDNRGCGRSSSPVTLHYSTAQMAIDALGLINHLKWSQCHVVGVSMGGMIALELAILAPEKLLSLTLIATHAGGLAGRAPFVGIRHILRSLVVRDEKLVIENAMAMLYGQETLSNEEKRQKFFDYHIERFRNRIPPSIIGIIGHLAAVQRHFVGYADLLRIRYASYPCLIFVGTEDRLVREANSYLIRRTLGCRLVKLENTGHGIQGERADEVNRELFDLFESIRTHDASKLIKSKVPKEFQLEIEAVEKCCQHRSACLIYDFVGFIKGFFLGSIFYLFSSLFNVTSFSFETVLILGCLSAVRRSVSCIYHSFRARRFVREHQLELKHAAHHGGVGVHLPEESKRGIPPGCGFEYPIPSMIFLMNLCVLIFWIRSMNVKMNISK